MLVFGLNLMIVVQEDFFDKIDHTRLEIENRQHAIQYKDINSFNPGQSYYQKQVDENRILFKRYGYFSYFEDNILYIYFLKSDKLCYKTELSDELHAEILRNIKKAPLIKRELADHATKDGWRAMNIKGHKWHSMQQITLAAGYVGIDIEKIIDFLLEKCRSGFDGIGSNDDGIIYLLIHSKHKIVKIGKTKSDSAQRAKNYSINHDDDDGWTLHHEVRSKNVSRVEARIHAQLITNRAAYGYNAKEVFSISTSSAMKAIYSEIEL